MSRVASAIDISDGDWELAIEFTEPPTPRGIRIKRVDEGSDPLLVFAIGLHGASAPSGSDDGWPLAAGESVSFSAMTPHGSGGQITAVWAKSDGAEIAVAVELM